MKKYVHHALAAIFSIVIFANCTKSTAPVPVNNTPTNTNDSGFSHNSLQVTVGSTSFAFNVSYYNGLNGSIVLIADSNYCDTTLRLAFPKDSLGTFPIPSVGYGSYTSTFLPSVRSYGVYGAITVTAVSPVLTGTFSYTCFDSTKIFNGTFAVKGF